MKNSTHFLVKNSLQNRACDKIRSLHKTPLAAKLTEEELVFLTKDSEYFNSPSVYRGSTPKGEGV